jgi:hypothetical protein
MPLKHQKKFLLLLNVRSIFYPYNACLVTCELPDAKAIRLPHSTTALAEARLLRMEIWVILLTSVAVLISRGVTSMRPACSCWFSLCFQEVLMSRLGLLGSKSASIFRREV